MEASKTCSRCRQAQPLESFPKDRSRNDGLSYWCRACHKEKWFARDPAQRRAVKARWRQRNPDYMRKWYYGLEDGQYDEMVAAQGGVCAICRERCSTGKKLAVDHDHVSGKVRGLLCSNCNRGIGFLRDDPARVRAAAEYLETLSQLLREAGYGSPVTEEDSGDQADHQVGECADQVDGDGAADHDAEPSAEGEPLHDEQGTRG